MRALAVLAIWVAATAAGLWVAAESRIGPVVFVVSQRHGVHRGDLVAFALAYACAAAASIAVVTWPRR